MKNREWEAILPGDPRGQPVLYYRGLVALVSCDPSISVVTKDGTAVDKSEWEDVARLIARAPALEAEVERLRSMIRCEHAPEGYDVKDDATTELAVQCADLEAENARLRQRCEKLEGQRNGWAETRHARWCCGPGEMCCCGHEEVKAQERAALAAKE
jgi:hypothetical protein